MLGDNKSGGVDEKAEYMNKFYAGDATAASAAGGQNQYWELFLVFYLFCVFLFFFVLSMNV